MSRLKPTETGPEIIDDLSALGLRHVGYGVPTEMFAPFAKTSALTLIFWPGSSGSSGYWLRSMLA